jgi:hypothetical protein
MILIYIFVTLWEPCKVPSKTSKKQKYVLLNSYPISHQKQLILTDYIPLEFLNSLDLFF